MEERKKKKTIKGLNIRVSKPSPSKGMEVAILTKCSRNTLLLSVSRVETVSGKEGNEIVG